MAEVYLGICNTIKAEKEREEKPELRKWKGMIEKKFRDNISKLYNDTFKNGVMKQLKHIMSNLGRNFIDELDKYPNIIGVGNGILVLGPKPQCIKGFHEFRISKYTQVEYKPYNRDDFYVNELMTAFADIFIEPDMLRFMLCFASMSLDISEINIYILQLFGAGANGKTFFLQMIQETLGREYAKKVPIKMLSDESEKASGANSALMSMEGRRFLFYSETNPGMILNTSRLKEILSPEDISARELYQPQKDIKIEAIHIIGANHILLITTTDHGIWRRFLHYNMKMTFKTDPNPDNKYEKKKDSKYERIFLKDDEYKKAMLSILIHYNQVMHCVYGYNLDNLIKNTPTLLRETEAYRNSQDIMNSFISSMIVLSPSAPNIDVQEIAMKYNDWVFTQTGTRKTGLSEVVSKLENSRIAGLFIKEGKKTPYLKGYRVLERQNEELIEGETYLQDTMNNNRENNLTNVDIYDRWTYVEGKNERYVDDDLRQIGKSTPLGISSNVVSPGENVVSPIDMSIKKSSSKTDTSDDILEIFVDLETNKTENIDDVETKSESSYKTHQLVEADAEADTDANADEEDADADSEMAEETTGETTDE